MPKLEGRYLPQRFHAQGGLGLVYVAKDREVGRDVALKVMQPLAAADMDNRRRFIAEAELTGGLEHPGIVPVYGILSDQRGQPYYAMRFIGGETLASAIQRVHEASFPDPNGRSVALQRLLQHFIAVCEAVGYAHSRGVIHRDLKPTNIMIGSYGETFVVDWGLAKCLTDAPSPPTTSSKETASPLPAEESIAQTDTPLPRRAEPTLIVAMKSREGTVLGTPAYMAPEQARGQIDVVDRRADVFSLGAILCEILTGAPPYRGRGGSEVLRLAAEGELRDARNRLDASGADAELTGIARVCLQPDPGTRPADAGAVAALVATYLASVESRLRQAREERAAALARADAEQARASAERRRRQVTAALALALLGAAGPRRRRGLVAPAPARRPAAAATRCRRCRHTGAGGSGPQLGAGPRGARRAALREVVATLRQAAEFAQAGGATESIRVEAEAEWRKARDDFAHAAKTRDLLAALLDVSTPPETGAFRKGLGERAVALAQKEPGRAVRGGFSPLGPRRRHDRDGGGR